MFSKEASKQIRQEFWTSFGKSFPYKWTLYNTKLKEVSFKFFFNTEKARVSIDFEDQDFNKRMKYYDKFLAFRTILLDEIPELQFSQEFILENSKSISCIYIEKQAVSIHNKNTWQEVMYFFQENMLKFEAFWNDYEDFIKA